MMMMMMIWHYRQSAYWHRRPVTLHIMQRPTREY